MAITVSFTGSPAELLELFQNNTFLDLIRKQTALEEQEKTPVVASEVVPSEDKKGETPTPVKEPEKPKISRQQMLHAVQEYAVRMYNRYKEDHPDLNVKDMCAELLLEQTEGSATHTSMVGDLFIERVYFAAVNDFIPSAYDYLVRR